MSLLLLFLQAYTVMLFRTCVVGLFAGVRGDMVVASSRVQLVYPRSVGLDIYVDDDIISQELRG